MVEETKGELGDHSQYFHMLVGNEIVSRAQIPSKLILSGTNVYTYKRHEEMAHH